MNENNAESFIPPLTTRFESFRKLARLSRNCIITEKLDGTNAQICIVENGIIPAPDITVTTGGLAIAVGSRNRWITPQSDNYGFAGWVYRNAEELLKLGVGRHFGEWWGAGIQRNYGLTGSDKRFSLFNTGKWNAKTAPGCCSVVPILESGIFTTDLCEQALNILRDTGSRAVPGFMKPEGIVCFHEAANFFFKKTLDNDALPKSLA